MSDSLIEMRKMLEKSQGARSLQDLVNRRKGGNAALVMDLSGSMSTFMRNGKTRRDGLAEAVAEILREAKPVLIAFGGMEDIRIVGQVPAHPEGGTPLAEAIEFAGARLHEHIVVLSDGEPNHEENALHAARNFKGRIDVIFVGDPGGPGERFLKELAALTGGTSFTGDLSKPKELSSGVIGLLAAGTPSGD